MPCPPLPAAPVRKTLAGTLSRLPGGGNRPFTKVGRAEMDLVPDTQQLAQVMSQATAPAFVLGAVAGFVSILLGRMTMILDRIRSLNEIGEDDAERARLKSDIPRLR